MERIQAMVTLGSVGIGVVIMIWKGGAYVNKINIRFDGLEKRMDKFEIRMDKFEIRLNDLSSDVIKIKERLKK